MLGAIIGDIVGSVFEFNSWNGNWTDFELFSENSCFTDDTIMTCAIADSMMQIGEGSAYAKETLISSMHYWGLTYPRAGYGYNFAEWLRHRQITPYNSFGNGSAMRVSPVGWAFNSLEDVEKYARLSAEVTHNHPEGIKGACAVAGSIFMARKGKSKNEIQEYVTGKYGYNLERKIDVIRENYSFDMSCQGSVPEAIIAFLESESFEEAIRKAVWLRGDADTQAAIAGSIAEAYYEPIPSEIGLKVMSYLDENILTLYSRWNKWLAMNIAG